MNQPITAAPVEPVVPPEGKLVSFLTGEFIRDTPEEQVRQQMLRKLIVEYGVPRKDIDVEKQIKVFSGRPRTDITIYKTGQSHNTENIIAVVECKATNQSEKGRSEARQQLFTYTMVLPNVDYAVYTEGGDYPDEFFAVKMGSAAKELAPIIEIPQGFKPLGDINTASKEFLIRNQHIATGDSLKRAMSQVHNRIAAESGFQKDIAFLQMIKILDAKLEDEFLSTHEFLVTQDEVDRHKNGNEQTRRECEQKVLKRVNDLLQRAIDGRRVLHDEANIDLGSKTASIVMFAVTKFQSFNLGDTHHSVREEAYQEFVGSNLRGDRGEFFTPREVTRHVIQMLDPQPNAIACDPAQGTGGFVQGIIDYVTNSIEEKMKSREIDDSSISRAKRQYVEKFVVGLDLNPRLVEATRTNVVFSGEAEDPAKLHFYQNDSLDPFSKWDSSIREALGISKKSYQTADGVVERWEGSVGYLATNPPFGQNIRKTDPEVLREFSSVKGNSESVEALFVERIVQLLKPGTGRAAIITPVGLLSNPDRKDLREWLLAETEVLASIELPIETFLPHTGTQTHIIILRRKTFEEVAAHTKGGAAEYPIFMASVGTVGHDRRGHPLHRRKDDGSIESKVHESVEADRDEQGNIIHKAKLTLVPHIDSQMPEVTKAFREFEQEVKLGAIFSKDGRIIRL